MEKKKNRINKFNIFKFKGKLMKISDWMKDHHFPPALLFFLMGIISTVWFLIRVIPKPSRAGYPCMKVAAPFMSGFIMYLLTWEGLRSLCEKISKIFTVPDTFPQVYFYLSPWPEW